MSRKVWMVCAAVLLICILGCGCSTEVSTEEVLPAIELLAYFEDSRGNMDAHSVSVDLEKKELSVSSESLFKLPKGTSWFGEQYPAVLTESTVVLRTEPEIPLEREYSVIKENELWFQDYVLEYDYDCGTVVLKQGEEHLGILSSLIYEDSPLRPISFFVDLLFLAGLMGKNSPSIRFTLYL